MLTLLDNVVVVGCIIGVILIGKYFSSTSSNMDAYYTANKALPWSLLVGTLMASWYGGAGVVGTVGYSTAMGFAGFFIWSIGAHAVRFPLALWVGPRISYKVSASIPDLMHRYYGKFASILSAMVLVVSCLSIGEIAATGYLGTAAWNMDKFLIAAIIIAISIFIANLGGLMGVAVTDMLYFFFMVTGVCIAFPKVFFDFGGLDGIYNSLNSIAPEMLTATGGISPGKALVLILICINIYKDPAFYQRFASANSPRVGRRALLTCFSIWLSFDVVTIMTGTLLRAMDPALTVQPETAYVNLVLSNLPVVLRGLFVVGILGAVISTIDSYYLVGGQMVATDIIGRLREKPLTDKQVIRIGQISAVIFGIIALSTAFMFPLVYDAVIFIASLSMSTTFVPVLMAIMYNGKKTNMSGILSMIVGGVAWVYFGYFQPVSVEILGGQVDPVLVALPLSAVAYFVGNMFGKVLYDDANLYAIKS